MSEPSAPPPAASPYPPPGSPQQAAQQPAPLMAGPPMASPAKKSKTGRIILIAVAAMVVLCLGGAAAIYLTIGDEVGDTIEATQTRVVAPETLGDRPRVNDAELQLVAEDMLSEVESDLPDLTSTAAGFYGDPAASDLVMIFAASALLADPAQELDDAMTGFGASNVYDVDPGPLGGEAACGDAQDADLQVGVCAWADRGSLGMIVDYFSTSQDLAEEFVSYRGQIQQS